jgi:histone acetyltransferase 1
MSRDKKVVRAEPEPACDDRSKRRKLDTPAVAGKFCNADESITLHLVRTAADLDGDEKEFSFPPEFTERFFGEEAKIYGYKGLKIDVWLHTVSFYAHANIHYDVKLRDGGPGNPTADLPAKMKEIFGEALIDKRENFIELIPQSTDSFLQMIKAEGTVVDSWRADGAVKSTKGKLCQIVRMELNDARVRKFYNCLVPLISLFIEGGLPIESDDPRWEIYLSLEGEGPEVVVAGFCTVYRFYSYPESTRLRVSQILVLPPYQGKGYGYRMLETIHRIAIERNCYDITFEDPSDSLQELRDCVDVQRLLQFPPAVAALSLCVARIRNMANNEVEVATTSGQDSVPDSSNGKNKASDSSNGKNKASDTGIDRSYKTILMPPPALIDEARKALKINKGQMKRCWESLLFLQLGSSELAIQEAFRELLAKKSHAELFSKKDEDVGLGKQIVDTDNDYNIDKTFTMMRVRQQDAQNSDANNSVVDASDEEKKLEALQDLLEEREVELQAVADKVSSRCKKLGISVIVK